MGRAPPRWRSSTRSESSCQPVGLWQHAAVSGGVGVLPVPVARSLVAAAAPPLRPLPALCTLTWVLCGPTSRFGSAAPRLARQSFLRLPWGDDAECTLALPCVRQVCPLRRRRQPADVRRPLHALLPLTVSVCSAAVLPLRQLAAGWLH
jgi:hypothetical protein